MRFAYLRTLIDVARIVHARNTRLPKSVSTAIDLKLWKHVLINVDSANDSESSGLQFANYLSVSSREALMPSLAATSSSVAKGGEKMLQFAQN